MDVNLKLGDDHDIIIGRSAVRTSGGEYTAQLIKCRLMTFLSEWVLNRNIGLPWWEVLEHKYDVSSIKLAVQNTILETKGVLSVDELVISVSPSTRNMLIEFVVTTSYGKISSGVSV